MFKVFTIIVTYNGMKWIDKCLKSVVYQSEVIVIDNNSTDDTLCFITERFPTVIVLPQTENLGFGLANNKGIDYAIKNGADAVFLLNQDAFAQTDCITNLKKAAQNNPEYGIISPIHLNGDGTEVDYTFLKVTSPFSASNLTSDLIVRKFSKSIYPLKFINAAAWFIPTEVFYKVGGFDPLFFLYGEDDNYCQRIIYHGFKIGIIPNATIFHDSTNSNYKVGEDGSEKYFRQFINNVYVKYADVNTEYYKKLNKLKRYVLKKAVIFLFGNRLDKSKLFFSNYKKINVLLVRKSILINRKKGSHYLDL
jgi:GT2 family glycosyltransferase